MSWGSIISTGGKILGKLLTSVFKEDGENQSPLTAMSMNLGAEGEENAHFLFDKSKNEVQLLNYSKTPSDVVIAFPGSPTMSPTTAILKKTQAFDLTPAFKTYAGEDCSQFELMSNGMSIDTDEVGAEDGVTVVSTGYNIPVGGGDVQVGAYLNVKVDKNSVTVSDATSNGVIKSINTLTINGSGDTQIKFSDQSGQDGKTVKLALPTEIKCNTVNVGVSVQYGNAKAVIEEINAPHILSGALKTYSVSDCLDMLQKASKV